MLNDQNSKFLAPVHLFTCTLVAFTTFFLLTFSSCDKEERLYGSWNLQTVLMNGELLNDSLQYNLIPKYTYYTFHFENILHIENKALALSSPDGIYYFKNNSTVNMKYSLQYKRFDIDAKIKKLNKKELHLEYEDNGNNYLLKLYSYSY